MRHAYRDRNDLDLLADQSPLGQILTDRAGGTVVTVFTMVAPTNIVGVAMARITTGGEPKQTGIRNNWSLVQSKKFVQALAKK
jgi:hypothetical protein